MPGIRPGVNDILQIRVAASQNNQESLNITHWKVTSVVTGGATLAEMALALDNTWRPAYKLWYPSAVTYQGTGVKNLTPPASLEFSNQAGTGAGTNTGNPVPTQVSGLIKKLSLMSGVSNRGRIYVGFVSTVCVDAFGEPNATAISKLGAINAAYDVSQTIVGGTGTTVLGLVIKHAISPTNPSPGLLNTPVDRMVVSTRFATQRRRGDYGKINTDPFS